MPWVASAVAGVCAGLAALAKLNGALAMIIVLAWTLLTLVLPWVAIGRKLAVMAMAAIAGTVSLITFVALEPLPDGPAATSPGPSAWRSSPRWVSRGG